MQFFDGRIIAIDDSIHIPHVVVSQQSIDFLKEKSQVIIRIDFSATKGMNYQIHMNSLLIVVYIEESQLICSLKRSVEAGIIINEVVYLSLVF